MVNSLWEFQPRDSSSVPRRFHEYIQGAFHENKGGRPFSSTIYERPSKRCSGTQASASRERVQVATSAWDSPPVIDITLCSPVPSPVGWVSMPPMGFPPGEPSCLHRVQGVLKATSLQSTTCLSRTGYTSTSMLYLFESSGDGAPADHGPFHLRS